MESQADGAKYLGVESDHQTIFTVYKLRTIVPHKYL